MRTHLSNAFYGVLDYVAWPAGMLVVAPIAVRALGIDRYGIWMVASSAISIGAIVASGIRRRQHRATSPCSARSAIRTPLPRSSQHHGHPSHAGNRPRRWPGSLFAPAMTQPPGCGRFRCCVPIACGLFASPACCCWCGPSRAFASAPSAPSNTMAPRCASSLAGRMLSLAAAAILPLLRPSVTRRTYSPRPQFRSSACGCRSRRFNRLLNTSLLTPRFDRDATRALLGFGKFTWMQAVSALLVGQFDRLITGAALGAAAVSSYAMCVQLSQPVYGITAAGLHFLFPHITAQFARNDAPGMRRTVLAAVAVNWAAVAVGTSILLLFGHRILRIWGGPAMARTAALHPADRSVQHGADRARRRRFLCHARHGPRAGCDLAQPGRRGGDDRRCMVAFAALRNPRHGSGPPRVWPHLPGRVCSAVRATARADRTSHASREARAALCEEAQ